MNLISPGIFYTIVYKGFADTNYKSHLPTKRRIPHVTVDIRKEQMIIYKCHELMAGLRAGSNKLDSLQTVYYLKARKYLISPFYISHLQYDSRARATHRQGPGQLFLPYKTNHRVSPEHCIGILMMEKSLLWRINATPPIYLG